MNVADLVSARAESEPETAAIIDSRRGRSRVLTFADLERAAARAATLLHQSGLRPGDAVLVFQPMSAELYVALAAIFRLGLVAMFLDPSAGREHIEQCCASRPPDALIASAKAHLLRAICPALRRIRRKFVIGPPLPGAVPWSRADGLRPSVQAPVVRPDTPALITFTSGSTGQPKAAVRSHGFLLAQHHALARVLALSPAEVDLTTMPIVALANLASGVTSLIPAADPRRPGAIEPGPILAQLDVHRVRSTVSSPALLQRLVDDCLARGLKLPHFSQIFTGGAPVFPRLLDQLQQLAPQARVVAAYGSTEAEPIACLARADLRPADTHAMLSGSGLLAGPPVSDIRVRILPDRWGTPIAPLTAPELSARCLPPNQAGEIVVSGDHVLQGYLDPRHDLETKFRVDGVVWHRTGDAGYLDPAGRVWLLGRCAARVADSHGSLYPFTVEAAASAHPNVRRSALVTQSGKRLLVVEGDRHLTNGNLRRLEQSLAWAQIDQVRPMPHIPVDRRHNAKVDYPALHRLLERS